MVHFVADMFGDVEVGDMCTTKVVSEVAGFLEM